MVFGPYDYESIRKAFSDPSKAFQEIKRLYVENVERSVYNQIRYINERNSTSEYGLVLHWNQFKNGRLGIAQSPFFIREFIEKFDPIVITTQKSYESHKNDLKKLFLYSPGGRAPLIEFDNDLDHTILALLSDPHSNIRQREEYVIQNDIDHVLTQYYSPFKRHFQRWDEYSVIHFPWAVPREFILRPDEIENRASELVVLGDYGGKPYETREWCSKLPYVDDPHRDVFQEKSYSGGGYYEWLRQFDAVVAANSLSDDFRYVTAKFFEIPAAGSLLFAQYSEDLDRLGFSEDNCIIFDKTNFEEKALSYLNSPAEYLPNRRKGAELIRNRHTISDRISKITELFES